jgi:hypothetical protein
MVYHREHTQFRYLNNVVQESDVGVVFVNPPPDQLVVLEFWLAEFAAASLSQLVKN